MSALVVAALLAGVNPDLLSAVCYVESRHDTAAYVHNDGGSPSYGMCQIKLNTARYMGYKGTAAGLMNPDTNALYAAKYLAYQIGRRGTVGGVCGYNAGNRCRNHKYVTKVKRVMGEKKWQQLQNAPAAKKQKKSASPHLATFTARLAKLRLAEASQAR